MFKKEKKKLKMADNKEDTNKTHKRKNKTNSSSSSFSLNENKSKSPSAAIEKSNINKVEERRTPVQKRKHLSEQTKRKLVSAEKKKGFHINFCVVIVLVAMSFSVLYLLWDYSVHTSTEMKGKFESGRMARSLRTWPSAVLTHHSAGIYVPIHDGERDLNIFVAAQGPLPSETEVVFLIHGFTSSSYSFRKIVPQIAAAGYYAVSFDLPGFGLSDKPEGPSYNSSYFASINK